MENLGQAFQLLVLGWGGVFIVLFIIYLASLGLSRFFPPKDGEL